MRHKITAGLAAVVLSLSPAVTAGGQGMPTYDNANLVQNITTWITDKLNHAEDAVVFAEQLKTMTKTYQQAEALYRKIMPHLTNGKAYWDLYNETKRVKEDYDLMLEYLDIARQTPSFSPSRAVTIMNVAERIYRDVDGLIEMANEIFSPNNAMDGAKRADKIEEITDRISESSNAIETMVERELKRQLEDELIVCTEDLVNYCLGFEPDPTVPVNKGLMNVNVTDILDDISTGGDGIDDSFEQSGPATNPVKAAIDFVTVAVAVLAAIMLVWGFARRTKAGEKQHDDALWKVFAGLIFIFLMLNVISALFVTDNVFNLPF